MKKRYIIIGNGVAGVSAFEEIRKYDRFGEIFLFYQEEKPYYYRASLSEMIHGKNTPEMLDGRTEAYYHALNIKRIHAQVKKVDAVNQMVYTHDDQYHFDELLIATGAAARKIPLTEDIESLVYRNFDDAQRITSSLAERKWLLIIGAGVLGLELAAAVRKLPGKHIAIVQHSGQIGRPILDSQASDWIIERLQTDGITLFLNDEIEAISGSTARLSSGAVWNYDLVVQTIGVTPIFPQIDELKAGKGIQIDHHCQTNLAHIYAAGDCTETLDRSHQKWTPSRTWLEASQQGKTAGANMAGVAATIPETTFYNASYLYKDHYVMIGEPHGPADEIHLWKHQDGYRKIRILDRKVIGALLISNRQRHLSIRDAINNHVRVEGDRIADPDFDWNFISGNNWDYHFF
ncbi:MAG: FAD/NAD(P)-binding oxidoreductase [Anaerolineae bacterium]|jgi:NAD(P)H-nitrite reductase large subunit|nr:FAD/NAD(P)-binding oxidoreductase [Anaerolineae bacterium]